MKADPFLQLRLLEIQALDATIDQARAHIANPPELARMQEFAREHARLGGELTDARIKRDDLATIQAKAEADVAAVRARRDRDQKRLDDGSVNNPTDLVHLQDEVTHLAKRITELEDAEIAVMEQVEEADGEIATLESALAATAEGGTALKTEIEANASRLKAEVERLAAERADKAEGMPSELIDLYDKLRASKGGVGAAELRRRQCSGCMLSLDSADLAAIKAKPSDEVVRCAECGRILVRTAESGL